MGSSKRGEGSFEDPASAQSETPSQPPAFEDPEASADEETSELGPPSEEGELSTIQGAGDSGISQLKSAIEAMLIRQAGPQVEGYVSGADSLSGAGNILGVGYALGDPRGAGDPGAPSLVVFTAERTSEDEVKGVASNAAFATDEELDATPITVVTTGTIDAFAHRMKLRPSPCGISVGHYQITAGTIGALARGRSGARRNRLFILSNNHVLANTNAGPINAPILQPGPFDGGVNPRDRIAVLERFVPINFASGATNYVDCATGWAVSSLVRREFVRIVNGQPAFFRVGGGAAAPSVGRVVGKSGRTTQLTQGRITAVGVTVNVNFGGGRVGTFKDQFSVVSTTNGAQFSAGGDSGSLIWGWDARRTPIGLLFAGGGGVTFANRIDRVLNALDISLVV
jgi:hypothetical protein